MQTKLTLDELTKSAKAAGLLGLGEVSNIGTSAILGATKTLKESKWEKKVLLGGLLGNLAAGMLDMDLPFANLGIESMAGIDAFVDNASDIAMGVAGASMAYKFANNMQKINNSDKSLDEKLRELGIAFPDSNEEETTKQEVKTEPIKTTEMNEEDEILLLKKLMKKHGIEEKL